MLESKVALVTGAGSGIGRAVALAYARAGAHLVVSDKNEVPGMETVKQLQAFGAQAIFVAADVARSEDCQAMVSASVAHYGRLDIACNNAGVSGSHNPTADYELEAWRQIIDVNLSGVFYSMRYQVPAMLSNGGGAIVNIASILGQVGLPNASAYVASKHGVVGLTKSTALEYASQGVRINAVGPGFIETPLIAHRMSDPVMRERLVSWHPIGRLGQAEEVAELVLWLSSHKASFVTGSYYPVDGGYLAR